MPGYLYQDQFVPYPVYTSPLDVYGQALQLKDQKFKSGLQNIRSRYDAILNTDLTNQTNQTNLRSGVENAMNKLSRVAATDVSLPENQGQINALFDNVLNDNNILYDSAWTRNMKNETNKADQLGRTKPELVTPQNLHPLYKAQEAYRNGDPNQRPGFIQFSPYYDYNTKYQGELDKIKADVDLIFSKGLDRIIGPDGKTISFDSTNQQQVESIKASKIKQMLYERVNSDAQAMHQMALDYDYNKDYGFYSKQGALDGLAGDLSSYKSLTTKLSQTLGNPSVSAVDKDQYQKQLDYYNSEVTRLTGLQSEIKDGGDPTKYYSFNHFVKDYVDAKALQYSHQKEGLLSFVPGYDILLGKTLDGINDAFKAQAKKIGTLPEVQTPYVSAYNSLIENPAGINRSAGDIAALGDMKIDTDGRLLYNLSFNNKTPESTVIVSPATGTMSPDQQKTLSVATFYSRLRSDLEGLGIETREKTGAAGQGLAGTEIPEYVTVGANGEDIIKNYSGNKDFYGPEMRGKIQGILDKYTPVFTKAGVDISSTQSILQLRNNLNDPAIKSAVEFGQGLYDKAFRGRFEFRPDQDTNIVLGQSGVTFIKGRVIIPESELSNAMKHKTAKALRSAGLLTEEEVKKGISSSGKATQEQMYGLSVYLPINGTPEEINDRMLKNSNYYQGSSKEELELRAISQSETSQFVQDVNNSSEFNLKTPFIQQGSNFVPQLPVIQGMSKRTGTNQEISQLNKLAEDIALQTGQDQSQVQQTLYNIIGSTNNPVKRYEAVNLLRAGLGSLSNEPITVQKFMQGIAGPEGASYSTGNAQTSAFGKYQITQGTFEKIKDLPSFPVTYKLESFTDFKKDPQLQELTMSIYSDYLLKKFSNPLAAAVAFYTGEASEETQAFQQNPTQALETYRDKTPSSGGSNTNMTIGAYLSTFLRNFRK